MTQHKKYVRRDEPTVAKPILRPVIATYKRQGRIPKRKQKVVPTSTTEHDFNNPTIFTPLVISLKGLDMTREKEDSEQNANGLGKTGSYIGVTIMTTKENNSTHDPGIAYPFGVECSDHATSKEDTINIINSINGVLEIGEGMVMDGGP
jgi:GH25 family lysozyme M1 (1,4-beta-N-acetylmuramidase)